MLKLAGLSLFNYKTPRQGLICKPGVLSPAADLRATMTTSDTASIKDLMSQTPDKKVANKGLVKRVDASEVISQRLNMLTVYIQLLLKIPEIIMSSDILDFFDISTVDGNFIDDLAEDGLSCIDIMLADQPKVNKTVGTRFTLPMSELDDTELVMWSFTSRRRDIGFSVEFNGVVVVPYQRVESHKDAIQGSFDVPPGTTVGDINLIWVSVLQFNLQTHCFASSKRLLCAISAYYACLYVCMFVCLAGWLVGWLVFRTTHIPG